MQVDKFDFQKRWEIGYPTFEKLYRLPKRLLLPLLDEICGSQIKNEHLLKEGKVTKVEKDDLASEISIDFYDRLSISPFGIIYEPEHGEAHHLIEFNRFFVIPETEE